MLTMSHQMENINEKRNYEKKNQMGILELKRITEMKIHYRGSTADLNWQGKKKSINFKINQ